MTPIKRAQRAFQDADDEWSRQLQRAFGRNAGDFRYTIKGMGEPGSTLRCAYYGFKAARLEWEAAVMEQRIQQTA